MEVDEEVLNLDPKEFGLPRGPAGQWASCVRVIDPVTVRRGATHLRGQMLTSSHLQAETVFKVDLEHNEAAFSAAVVTFHSHPNEVFLVVGTGQDTSLAPRACKQAYLHTYKLLEEGRQLELLHKTEVDDIPKALIAFQGRLVAGVGKALRLYDLGKKKLLRKAENKVRRA